MGSQSGASARSHQSYPQPACNLRPLSARQRNAIKWRFADGPIVAHVYVLIGCIELEAADHSYIQCSSKDEKMRSHVAVHSLL